MFGCHVKLLVLWLIYYFLIGVYSNIADLKENIAAQFIWLLPLMHILDRSPSVQAVFEGVLV